MTYASQPVDDGGWEQWRTLTVQAYGRYHDQLFALRGDYPGLTDYNASERVEATADFEPAMRRALAHSGGTVIVVPLDPEVITTRGTLSAIREAALKR